MSIRVLLAGLPMLRADGLLEVSAAPCQLRSYVTHAWSSERALVVESTDFPSTTSDSECVARILRFEPDLLGLSIAVWSQERAITLCRRIRTVCPGVRIIVGGPQSTSAGPGMYAQKLLDGFVCGEGEEKLLRLLEALANDRLSSCVAPDGEILPGLLGWSGELACPWRDGSVRLGHDGRYAVTIEQARGCPFGCAYCDWGGGLKPRVFASERVISQLNMALRARGVQSVFISHFDMFSRKEDARRILAHLVDANERCVDIYACIAPGSMEAGLLELASWVPGLTLGLGVQSTDSDVLASIGRARHGREMEKCTMPVVRHFPAAPVAYDVIAGLPHQSIASIHKTIDDILSLRPFSINVYTLQVLPGSKLWDRAESEGIVFETRQPFRVLRTAWLSELELAKVRKLAIWAELCIWDRFVRDVLVAVGDRSAAPLPYLTMLVEFIDRVAADCPELGRIEYPDPVSTSEEGMLTKARIYKVFGKRSVRESMARTAMDIARRCLPATMVNEVCEVGADYLRLVGLADGWPTYPPVHGAPAGALVCVQPRCVVTNVRSRWAPDARFFNFECAMGPWDLLVFSGEEEVSIIHGRMVRGGSPASGVLVDPRVSSYLARCGLAEHAPLGFVGVGRDCAPELREVQE